MAERPHLPGLRNRRRAAVVVVVAVGKWATAALSQLSTCPQPGFHQYLKEPKGHQPNYRKKLALSSACQLRGDYDIRVDYELLTWPFRSGVRIGLADDHANMQRISSGRQPYDYPEGPDLYLTTFDTADHVVGITPTSDLSGKLRLERVDDTLTSYYFANGAWTLVASYSDPAYTQDTPFYLGSWSADSVFTDQEVKLAFDNLIINEGELVCPRRVYLPLVLGGH
jgi:hypothetical protein